MRYEEDLQLKVRERYRKLLISNYATWISTLKVTCNWIRDQRQLVSLLEEASLFEPNLDLEGWAQESLTVRGHVDWPHTTEQGQASLSWTLMNEIATKSDFRQVTIMLTNETNYANGVRQVTEDFIQPLFDYFTECISDASSVLYAMSRYVRVIEWFDRDELSAQYRLDTGHGEEIYNKHLRRFLFSEGFEMPYSEAASPSGESDILSNLESDDPVVCELKLFDNDSKGKLHVASGVHQALQYAQDHGKNNAYLVVVNLSGRQLNLPSDGEIKSWPPYVDLDGVRIYLITVRGNRLASASKLGKPNPINWTRGDLISKEDSSY